jgi:predicted glycogen debranching enzyme
MIKFARESLQDLDKSLSREWLETNGIGGFASSTVAGLNTRRYHALLVAATRPPVGRLVLLAKLEETILIDGRAYELSCNQYPEAIHPKGHLFLKEFRLDPFPTFVYEVEGIEFEKTVFMIHGQNSTVVRYRARGLSQHARCALVVRPLIAFRDYHATTRENGALNRRLLSSQGLVTVAPYEGMPALYISHDGREADESPYWYKNFEYREERERGLDFVEDLYSPFALKFDLDNRSQAAIIASTEPKDAFLASRYELAELERRLSVMHAGPGEGLVHQLMAAADQYIAARGNQKTVIAGYHWFSDWGRDTMIALPGLTLVTGRAEVAKSILLEFSRYIDRGMLPNRFPDAGEEPEYNTVDATLWFIEAVRALLHYTNDHQFVRANLYGALNEIIDWHARGTRYGIRVDEDGLLDSGEEGAQLTWMDAKVGNQVVTPRRGKPVEIQALWYNALSVMERLAREFGDAEGERRYGEMARRAKKSFNKLFWNADAGCLYDVISGDGRDGSIRPNQIFAVSLTHTMLSREKARRVVEAVEAHLLTPYGLRSLAPSDPQYTGRYEGDMRSRDFAYHQGTVWAWLMGPFITAYVKVNDGKRAGRARSRAAEFLSEFAKHLNEAGLGQVSEIFDGDAPHAPRGCIAQAWSVAELLRAAIEDVFEQQPSARRAKSA